MSAPALNPRSNADLEWNLDKLQSRQKAREFVLHFESRLCIYSDSVEQLYTNYTINFPSRDNAPLVILPNPYAFHDTYSSINSEAVRDTGLFIIPGETIGKRGLHIVQRSRKTNALSPAIPFRNALRKILSSQASDDPFLPVLVKGDLREFDSTTPCLHLHRIRLNQLERISSFQRNSVKRAINENLYNLYRNSADIQLS
ncbi:MAG: hypothetical protein LAT62_15705 [Natronospirillum sp.]|uniref:hypothetical protein n=1 Tax=Natronospirillum sp. TaxID=2812955 RepID=UPI0025D2F732|nr:hypothetical protein [Natronospirillum sp.]MCH8553383.1 hypothetical protein [Natronospirillum sp.]